MQLVRGQKQVFSPRPKHSHVVLIYAAQPKRVVDAVQRIMIICCSIYFLVSSVNLVFLRWLVLLFCGASLQFYVQVYMHSRR